MMSSPVLSVSFGAGRVPGSNHPYPRKKVLFTLLAVTREAMRKDNAISFLVLETADDVSYSSK
jgi:hypothetical protein